MARSICNPCCAPQEFARSNESFKASVLQVLCDLKELQEELYMLIQNSSIQVLCSPGGATVLLQVIFDGDGNLSATAAYNLDGTEWVGDINSLIPCNLVP